MCAGITVTKHEHRRLHVVASCGLRCARAGASTLTAWPTSSPWSADKDEYRDRGRVVWPHRSLLGSAPRARAHAPQLEALGLWARRQARRSRRRKRSVCSCLALHQRLQRWLLGKRSASGRKRWSGSGGHRHAPRRGNPQACPVGGWLIHGRPAQGFKKGARSRPDSPNALKTYFPRWAIVALAGGWVHGARSRADAASSPQSRLPTTTPR